MGPVPARGSADGPVPFTLGSAPVRAHQPLVAAGVSRSSQGASPRPWTPAPITPVSPLGSYRSVRTRRIPARRRDHELVDGGRNAGGQGGRRGNVGVHVLIGDREWRVAGERHPA